MAWLVVSYMVLSGAWVDDMVAFTWFPSAASLKCLSRGSHSISHALFCLSRLGEHAGASTTEMAALSNSRQNEESLPRMGPACSPSIYT